MSTSLRIPARFIQTWKSRALPARYEDNVTRLRDLHPDFEYFFFTDEECLQFVETEYPQYASIYKSFENTIRRFSRFRMARPSRYGPFTRRLGVQADTSRNTPPRKPAIQGQPSGECDAFGSVNITVARNEITMPHTAMQRMTRLRLKFFFNRAPTIMTPPNDPPQIRPVAIKPG